MIKKYTILSFLLFSLLLLSTNGASAAGGGILNTSFMAGLWSSMTGRLTLLFSPIWSPFFSPPVQVNSPTGQTMSGAVQGAQNQAPLYIPGKFGFGGTGGVITSTPFPMQSDKPRTDVSDIGNILNNTKGDITPTPNVGYPKPDLSPDAEKLYPARIPVPATKPPVIRTATTTNATTTPPYIPVTNKVPSNQIISLGVVTSQSLNNVTEGMTIKFQALIKLSDGTTRDISNEVKWAVLGDVGSITPAGIFTARLGISLSEFGEGVGSVVATYISSDGRAFLGNLMVKVVSSGFDSTNANIGGQ